MDYAKYSGSSVIDYIKLTKPRITALVVFTAFCGMMSALNDASIHPLVALSALIGIAMGSSSAATINMWYDKDIDALMKRTSKRPIVTGLIHPDDALIFGVICGIISVSILVLCVNVVSALALLFTILYYVLFYTMYLKRNSASNVVVGGVAGALPPVIGYLSVNPNFSIQSFILFSIIFLWTPTHSWALALFKMDEYSKCKIPMLPVVSGITYTKKCMLFYTSLMIIVSFLPYFFEMAGIIYLVFVGIMNCIFMYYVISLFYHDYIIQARKLFIFSIFYLFLVFLLLFEKYLKFI